MADRFATRVARIVGWSVNALIDAAENVVPQAVMTQGISEIDQVMEEVRVELALVKGQETLARTRVARQVDIEDRMPVLQRSLQQTRVRSVELEGYIAALRAKKREMESALSDLIATNATKTSSGPGSTSAAAVQARVDRAHAAFDRVLVRQSGVSGMVSGRADDAAKLHDLAELARKHRIEERLATLKSKKP